MMRKKKHSPLQHWVCCYDISNPKRLAKVHQLLSKEGIAINYSVFYLYVDPLKLGKLQQQLKKMLSDDDDMCIYAGAHLYQAYHVGEVPHVGNHLIGEKGVLL